MAFITYGTKMKIVFNHDLNDTYEFVFVRLDRVEEIVTYIGGASLRAVDKVGEKSYYISPYTFETTVNTNGENWLTEDSQFWKLFFNKNINAGESFNFGSDIITISKIEQI